MNEVNEMLRSLDLLNESELEAVAELCQAKIEWKKKAHRNALRKELMANLQQAIGAILGNGFELTITNWDRNHSDGSDEVYFCPDDRYSIKIE